ncbi:MAG: hypothetical protein JW934_08670 [Anaerolineae bacterium]|nr:hypothetical protein [Anaerolineae bacterium]
MSTYYLEYRLEQGFVHNWVVAGPQAIPVDALERFEAQERKMQIAEHFYDVESGIEALPVDRDVLAVGQDELKWAYRRCLVDHLVDLSTFCHTWTFLRAWAYTQLVAPEALQARMTLTTNGPADVWINGQHVHRQAHFHHQQPYSVAFEATLQEGINEVLVRFEEVAARECPYAMALQLELAGDEEQIVVRVPTHVDDLKRFQSLEALFEHAYVEENVLYKGNRIPIRWSDEVENEQIFFYHIQDERGRTYIEGHSQTAPSKQVDAGHQARLWERQYFVTLRPNPREYFDFGTRIQRQFPFHVLDTLFSEAPYGTLESRKAEALENAARRQDNLFAEIAKMQLSQWDKLDINTLERTIDKINRRGDCSDFDLVGLLGALYRYGDDPAFPEALKTSIRDCALGFKYWHDEPGVDAMCYTTENHSILFHTCEVLAGQLYPEEMFGNASQPGHWHRQKGEALALDWLRSRGQSGFREWDSNCYFEEDLLALSHLADLAETETVRELATILMDKLFFIMAINSYKGVFGSTHGRTYAPFIKGGQLEATSGISRLMWGMGVWNHNIRGVVALACSGYELPFIIADIAARLPEEFWSRERIAAPDDDWRASGSLGPEVNKVTYKTPDYMLCSAQDYHPGEKGYQQHIWQATLGPNAAVWVNHPPCAGEQGAHRPNFWHGNAVLPRVAQWKDVLIAIHRLPEDDWLGFTHAYFPTRAFDSYTVRDGWAFAQKGAGYLALTASQGIELVKTGPSGYYELRSKGSPNVWLCQMGRSELDGSLGEFQNKVLKASLAFDSASVAYTSLRGDVLSFGWQGPLTLNGEAQALAGFKHIENPYCTVDLPATGMEIRFDEYLLRLNFE